MQFSWWTLALQVINFLILVWLLQRFLYKPVLAAIDARRNAIEKAAAEAAAARRQAEAEAAGLRARQQEVEEERRSLRRDAEAQAARRVEEALVQAKAEAERLLAEAREQITAERAAAAGEVRQQAARLSATLASRLLARAAGGVSAEPFLERLVNHLESLPKAARAALTVGLAPEAPARVDVAPPLDEAGEKRWRRRLEDALGGATPVAFASEPGLIAGVRMTLPTAIVDMNWAEALADAEAGLERDAELPG